MLHRTHALLASLEGVMVIVWPNSVRPQQSCKRAGWSSGGVWTKNNARQGRRSDGRCLFWSTTGRRSVADPIKARWEEECAALKLTLR